MPANFLYKIITRGQFELMGALKVDGNIIVEQADEGISGELARVVYTRSWLTGGK